MSVLTTNALRLISFAKSDAFPQANKCPWGNVGAVRYKMVTRIQNSLRPAIHSNWTTKTKRLGVRVLSSDYAQQGSLLVKQRLFRPVVTSKANTKYVKIYPGENVRVLRCTSLTAAVDGRVKFTYDVARGIKLINVLPEREEDLFRDDLWRYQNEYVNSIEENKHLVCLRTKSLPEAPHPLRNPPTKLPPRAKRLSGPLDIWENPAAPTYHRTYNQWDRPVEGVEKVLKQKPLLKPLLQMQPLRQV